MLVIDGAYGEGGGQIIRTAVTLAAILSQPLRLENIRARRKKPGLAAQHLTAVRAAAQVCAARLRGDSLGSTQLTFEPQQPPLADDYHFDVAAAREGGSAGATSLVLQTALLPLIFAHGTSEVIIKGGTHVAWSPSFHYIQDVYLPTLADLGLAATATLAVWGWYPVGQGEILLEIPDQTAQARPQIPADGWLERGPLRQIRGVAVAANLPAHIAQRMGNRALKLLEAVDLPADIQPQRVRSASPGAGIFLVAEYGDLPTRAGFMALGRKGKPSEQVAQEAVEALLAFHDSGAVCDAHLTDQLIVPVALLGLPLTLSTAKITSHTLTNLWVVEQFLGPVATVDRQQRTIRFMERERTRT